MKKIIVILFGFSLAVFANFSEEEAKELAKKAAKIRQELKLDKAPLTEEEKKIIEIRKELNLPYSETKRDIKSLRTDEITLKSIVAEDDTSDVTEKLGDLFSTATKHLFKEKKESDGSFYEIIGLKEGEYLGLPSIFGINEKKETTFGLESLSDVKILGGTLYKGLKHSGESAEFMSGMMYYNAKMYNTMFGIFDDSPFNIFEDEDENSIFDIFEKGNDILDIFD